MAGHMAIWPGGARTHRNWTSVCCAGAMEAAMPKATATREMWSFEWIGSVEKVQWDFTHRKKLWFNGILTIFKPPNMLVERDSDGLV